VHVNYEKHNTSRLNWSTLSGEFVFLERCLLVCVGFQSVTRLARKQSTPCVMIGFEEIMAWSRLRTLSSG
jgi:hypothetical protein